MRLAIARGVLDELPSSEPLYVVAAGKAAWPMARAFCDHCAAVESGVVSGPRPPAASGQQRADWPRAIEWQGGGHPWPNEASERAGRRALEIASAARARGSLVVLLSGGASAMLAVPVAGIALADKARAARALMNAGAPIHALNCVRKHLSDIKGGRLASLARRTVTLAISDVSWPVEDDPSVIGSGPTVGDPSTFADALEVIRSAGAAVPPAVDAWIARGAAGELEETPKPGARELRQSTYTVIGSRRVAMSGARARAEELGYAVHIIELPTSGIARHASKLFVESVLRARADATGPLCVIASGETTVRVRGNGRGGRNQEFALAAAPLLAGIESAALGSVGTDGIDGPTVAAGALVDTTTLTRAESAGLSWDRALANNGAYDFFAPLGDLITWGPTGTNVGDVQVMVMGANW